MGYKSMEKKNTNKTYGWHNLAAERYFKSVQRKKKNGRPGALFAVCVS